MIPTKKIVNIINKANQMALKDFNSLGAKKINYKKHAEIVTITDKKINKFITGELKKLFPKDNIISEEAPEIKNHGERTWYIDPIDGTTNFSYGLNAFAVCLACVEKNKIIFGTVGIPVLNEVYWSTGKTAHLNNKKIKVSDKQTIRDGHNLIFACDGHSPQANKKFFKVVGKINVQKYRVRVLSSAGVELTGVASGRADGAILPEVHPWDVLAGVLLVRSAGGRATNFDGKNWTIQDSTLIVSNGKIHNYLLKLVK